MSTTTKAQQAFQLKGSLFTLSTLHVAVPDLGAIEAQLDQMAAQAPNFFQQLPIVVDCQALASPLPFTPQALVDLLRSKGLAPVGFRTADAALKLALGQLQLAVLPPEKKTVKKETKTETVSKSLPAKIVHRPVRSGQQIYAQDRDLVILAPVSAGAEVISDGHIHIYGDLRGRAIAGAKGDQTANIFCRGINAELVSIAGVFMSEQLRAKQSASPIRIYLDEGHIEFTEL